MFILLTNKTLSILKYISFDFLVRIVEVQRAVPGVPSQKRKIYRRKSRSDSSLKDEGLLTALRKWTSGDKKVPFSFDRSSEQLAQLECFKQGIVSIITNTIKRRSVNSYVLFSGQVMSLYK